MSHYIAIFVEDHIGEWRVVFPDLPGCEARGFTLDDAQYAAASTLARCLHENGTPSPLPMDMAGVAKRDDWLKRNHVDLSKAVVSMISVAA
jgi:predicted RNase H-like HicB family nuclease